MSAEFSMRSVGLSADGVEALGEAGLPRIRVHSRRLPGKRAGDIVVSLLALVLLLPVVLVAVIAIKLESRGPVLFRQARLGRGGQTFTMLKFRSMIQDSHEALERILEDDRLRLEYQTFHKLVDDPRVTSVGRFLRRSSLDEVPQLVNVLLGDMSIVGPRPYLPDELGKMGPAASHILSVRPGLTGLWQTSGRNRLAFSERVRLDTEYVRTASWWRDARFLAATLPAIIKGEGAH